MAKKIKRKTNQEEDKQETKVVSQEEEGGEKREGEVESPEERPKVTFGGKLGRFEMKIDEEDRWEFWSIASLILAGITLIILVISMMGLGEWSVIAWIQGLLYCGFATLFLGFFGLFRVIFHPPPIRRTRTIAFVALLAVGFIGLAQPRPFGIPLTTKDWTSDVPISLPFVGEWITIQGDDKENFLNDMNMPPLMWNYMFTAQKEGKIRVETAEPAKLEDYYCWDQKIVAPVDGEIVDFATSNPDLPMGGETAQVAQINPLGNFVAIKFGEHDFLYVSGMKSQSIVVKPGEHVKRGQEIGRCGRSGYAMFPSVMLHGQNSLNFPYSEGLPIKFSNIKINGTLEEKGTPKGVALSTEMLKPEGNLVENSF